MFKLNLHINIHIKKKTDPTKYTVLSIHFCLQFSYAEHVSFLLIVLLLNRNGTQYVMLLTLFFFFFLLLDFGSWLRIFLYYRRHSGVGQHCPGGVAQCIEGGNHKQRTTLNGCAAQVALTLQLVCFLACAFSDVIQSMQSEWPTVKPHTRSCFHTKLSLHFAQCGIISFHILNLLFTNQKEEYSIIHNSFEHNSVTRFRVGAFTCNLTSCNV